MLRLIVFQISTQGFNSVLGLVYWAVAARLLTIGDVGRAAATLAVIALLAATSNLGAGTALVRFRYAREWDLATLAGNAVAGASFVALLLSVAVVIFLAVSGDTGIVVAPWALVPMVLISLACNLLDSMSIADNDGFGVLLRNQTATLAKLLLLVLFVRDDRTLVLTTMGALLLSGLVVWPRRRNSVSLSIAVPHLPSRFARFALKQYVVTWFSNLPNYLFPILALALLGPEAAGYVALAWGGASLLFSAGDAAGIALLREESRDARTLGREHRRSILVVAGGLTASVVLAVAAAPVLTLVFGSRFDANAIGLFRLFVVASLPYFVASTTVGRLQARDQSSRAVVLVATSGLGGCVLLIAFGPLVGPLAPGWAYLVSNTVAALVALWLLGTIRQAGGTMTEAAPEEGVDLLESYPSRTLD